MVIELSIGIQKCLSNQEEGEQVFKALFIYVWIPTLKYKAVVLHFVENGKCLLTKGC